MKKKISLIIILLFSLLISYELIFKKENISYMKEIKVREKVSKKIDSSIMSLTYDDVSMLQYEEGLALDRLNLFSKKDKRIKKIIANYDEYPITLMEALSRNIELTDFVLNYKEKMGNVYSDDIGILDEEIPQLFQWDERWGYGNYGQSNIAISGCGPTSLAMVASFLLKDNTITPYKIAKLAEEKGYYIENSGTTWDLFTKGSLYLGLQYKVLPLSKQAIYDALEKGHPIVCSMRKGDFTINGHYLVLVGIEEGLIKINDPNSKVRSDMLWDYDRIKTQIRNLWEFYLE